MNLRSVFNLPAYSGNRPDINEVIENPWVEPFNKLYRPTGIQFD